MAPRHRTTTPHHGPTTPHHHVTAPPPTPTRQKTQAAFFLPPHKRWREKGKTFTKYTAGDGKARCRVNVGNGKNRGSAKRSHFFRRAIMAQFRPSIVPLECSLQGAYYQRTQLQTRISLCLIFVRRSCKKQGQVALKNQKKQCWF